jgi:hypothetical protein
VQSKDSCSGDAWIFLLIVSLNGTKVGTSIAYQRKELHQPPTFDFSMVP